MLSAQAPLRVLLVASNLKRRSGMVLHVRDLALALLRAGQTPIVYSPRRGAIADELRRASVAVPESLDQIGPAPDIIHGHTQLETMVAALTFPATPVVATCHGFASWQNAAPPQFPRLRRYIAVDGACADRLILECAVPEPSLSLQLNFVDLRRFPLRAPLPEKPLRAVVFSNEQRYPHVDLIAAVCQARGVVLEFLGGREHQTDDPGAALQRYDLAFAKGRSALEALAAGLSVVLSGPEGLGPMVTSANFDVLRPLNFGLRNLRSPVEAATVHVALDAFDARDARLVSERLRRDADLDRAVEQMVALYRDVVAEYRRTAEEPERELQIAGTYLAVVQEMYRERIREETALAAREARARLEQRSADSRQNLRARVAKARQSARRSREREQQMSQAVDALQRAVTELGREAHEQRLALEQAQASAAELRSTLERESRRGLLSRLWRRVATR